MIIPRVLAATFSVAVVVAGIATGPAGPAHADEVIEGIYTYTEPGMPPATWTIFPMCVPVVGDLREPLYIPVGCALHVASSTSSQISQELKVQNWTGDARLTGGRWTAIINKPKGVLCPDGSSGPTVDTYSFDDTTLQGTHTITHPAVCGLQPNMAKIPFTLTYLERLPIPVERYPLRCEPAGLRICS